MTRAFLALSLVVPLVLLAGESARGLGEARSELVVTGLTQPVFAAAPPGDTRLFVVERAGRIRIVENDAVLSTPFLDIQSLVGQIGEGGFLGLAFPSDYAASGLFYVYHTTPVTNDSVVARYSVTGDPNVADPASRLELLFIDQPDTTHNHRAGTIAFGPDGFLWFATGDGGGGGDPDELAQNGLSLLGKMLRLDVGPTFAPDSIDVGEAYRIPADNPYLADPGTRDEIWARGFRNPYRWSFDRATGDAWIADVGQATWEEVNLEPAGVPGGRNYGWDIMENTRCLSDPYPTPPCNDPSLLLPLYAYDHSEGNCSITGGYVHRAASPLDGLYFFGDYCTGRIWTLDPATVSVVERTAELGAAAGVGFVLVGFGEAGDGTLHVVHRNGSVHRILSADPECGDGIENDGDGLTDFPADPGCREATSVREDPQCDDGLDNDGDGDRDWDGAGVGDPDVQCAGDGWRNREKAKGCGLGLELGLALPALLALRQRRRTAR